MIWYILCFIFGVIVGTLVAGYFFACVRDRDRAELSEFLHEERKLREDA